MTTPNENQKPFSEQQQSLNQNEKGTLDSLATVIPQVFYDVIARIIPGGIVLVLLYLGISDSFTSAINDATTYLTKNHFSTFILFCMWLLLSYGISIMLWRQIEWIRFLIPYKKIPENILKFFEIHPESYIKHSATHELNSYLYDYIKSRNQPAGARITKLRAEIHMTEVLSVGLLYCIFLFLFNLFTRQCVEKEYYYFGTISIIFFFGIRQTRKYFCRRASVAYHNYYIIYNGPPIKAQKKKLDSLKNSIY